MYGVCVVGGGKCTCGGGCKKGSALETIPIASVVTTRVKVKKMWTNSCIYRHALLRICISLAVHGFKVICIVEGERSMIIVHLT